MPEATDLTIPDVTDDRRALSTGAIHKKRMVDQDTLTLAQQRVAEAFDLFDHIVVSFSGGKDSTATLMLTVAEARRRGKLPVHAVFYDEEAIPYETEDYVRRVAESDEVRLDWYSVPIKHRNAASRRSPYWFPWAPEDEEKWVRPMPPESLTWEDIEGFPIEPDRRPSMPDSVGLLFPVAKYGRVGMLMGIRSSESITRTRAILMRTPDSRPWIRPWQQGFSQRNLWKVYPIYDWSTADVWTAPDEFGWDYNRTYDIMELMGVPHDQQRCAPPYGEEPLHGLDMFAVCFPDIWVKMYNRVPGAATAARYSRTELYSYNTRPQKPGDTKWPDYIRYWIEKHPAEYRGEIAARVQHWIKNHFDKTHEPLAATAPHPVSGVSWDFLLMIAVRGDFKDRKQPQMSGVIAKRRAAYDREIAAMRARGEI